MKIRQSKRVVIAATVAVSAVLLNLAWADSPPNQGSPKPSVVPEKQATLEQIRSETLPGALKAIAAARQAIQAGHSEHALAELQKVEQALKAIQTSLTQHTGPKFANTMCPIMGSPIDPAKVTESLTRVYKGQKVAFCCDGCPSAWDKLTDAQRDAKLKQAPAQPAKAIQAAPGHAMNHMGH